MERLVLINNSSDVMIFSLDDPETKQDKGRLKIEPSGFSYEKPDGTLAGFEKENIVSIAFQSLENDELDLVVTKKTTKAWRESIRRKHPVLTFLGLLKVKTEVEVTCGTIANPDDAKEVEVFLQKHDYDVHWQIKEV